VLPWPPRLGLVSQLAVGGGTFAEVAGLAGTAGSTLSSRCRCSLSLKNHLKQ